MRCPKCHYLSFDPEPRCKNCGYDLEVDDADLALRTSERPDAQVPDLTLHARPDKSAMEEAPITLELAHAGPRREPRARKASAIARDRDIYVDPEVPEIDDGLKVIDVNDDVVDVPDIHHPDDVDRDIPATIGPALQAFAPLVRVEPEPEPTRAPEPVARVEEPPRPVPFRSPHTTTDMPLFVKGIADREVDDDETSDQLMGQPPVVPVARPPLAVRRTAPDPVRAKPKPIERRLGPLDHDLLEDLKRVEREEALRAHAESREVADDDDRVEPSQRAAAAAIDVAVLGGIAGFVFWATLRLTNVSIWDLGFSALMPLMSFLVLMDVGYLLLFTAAGGQTVGKMLMGLRVVGEPADPGHHIPLARAAFRSAMTLVSVAGLGLGWVPALFGRGLTLHDRVTHTRVVRV